ncbi:hypothetical protein DIPPA_24990 [Diplonema papillatum]|nr:hypothetical protein DIPPA_24990 [Diplonema papillatum]
MDARVRELHQTQHVLNRRLAELKGRELGFSREQAEHASAEAAAREVALKSEINTLLARFSQAEQQLGLLHSTQDDVRAAHGELRITQDQLRALTQDKKSAEDLLRATQDECAAERNRGEKLAAHAAMLQDQVERLTASARLHDYERETGSDNLHRALQDCSNAQNDAAEERGINAELRTKVEMLERQTGDGDRLRMELAEAKAHAQNQARRHEEELLRAKSEREREAGAREVLVQSLKGDVAHLRDECTHLRNSEERAQAAAADAQAALQRSEAKVDQLLRDLSAASEQHVADVARLTAEVNAKSLSEREADGKARNLQHQVTGLQNDLQREREETKTMAAQLHTAITELRESRLKGEDLSSSLEDLAREKADLEKGLTLARIDTNGLRSELSRLTAEYTQMVERDEQGAASRGRDRDFIRRLESRVSELEEECNRAKRELAELLQHQHALTTLHHAEVQKNMEEIQSLRRDLAKMQEACGVWETSLNDTQRRLREEQGVASKLGDAHRRIKELEAKVSELEGTFSKDGRLDQAHAAVSRAAQVCEGDIWSYLQQVEKYVSEVEHAWGGFGEAMGNHLEIIRALHHVHVDLESTCARAPMGTLPAAIPAAKHRLKTVLNNALTDGEKLFLSTVCEGQTARPVGSLPAPMGGRDLLGRLRDLAASCGQLRACFEAVPGGSHRSPPPRSKAQSHHHTGGTTPSHAGRSKMMSDATSGALPKAPPPSTRRLICPSLGSQSKRPSTSTRHSKGP